MRFTRIHAMLGVGALALTLPVLAQQRGPESILPPGFGDAAQSPPPRPAQPASPSAPEPARPTPAADQSLPPPPSGTLSTASPDELAAEDAAGNASAADDGTDSEAELAQKYDFPPQAKRSIDTVGPLTPAQGGLDRQAFGTGNGEAMARIMRATRAPFVSRWGSILLRRALLSQTDRPNDVDGADWVAERAWLLLRMGEADNARLLIQGVDNDRYNRRLYAIAMQTHLATADPAGLCRLLPRARDFSGEPSWFMAQAICASFSADQNTATAILSQAERRGIARGIDYRLAEKTVGAGPKSRRSVKIEWDAVSRLTTWRFGLATATNVEIPDALYSTVGPQVRAWEARAPILSLTKRLPGTTTATRLGVFSGSAALSFFDRLAEQPDADTVAQETGEMLRTAFGGESDGERVAAMRRFWSKVPADGAAFGPGDVDYGALPVLSRAAASVKADAAIGTDTPWLIAAMLSGGYDRNAARWVAAVDGLQGSEGQRSWALLAAGLPSAQVNLSAGRIDDFIGQDDSDRQRLSHAVVAALGGLGRLPQDRAAELLKNAGIDMTPRSRWARALLAAADRREQGTVALLAAVGMQTNDWRRMPAVHLYFITEALRRVGLDPYARMIAAEAIART